MTTLSSALRFLVLLFLMGASLYSYIGRENSLTQAELMLAPIAREVGEMEEQNAALRYQLSRFEAPSHLFQIASHALYGHLDVADSEVLARASEVEETAQQMPNAPQRHIAASAR